MASYAWCPARILVLLLFAPRIRYSDAAYGFKQGIQLVPNTCTGEHLGAAQHAILEAGYLASAGFNAARSYRTLPFTSFFAPTRRNSHTVTSLYHGILWAQQGKGGRIDVTCKDLYNRCNSTHANSSRILPAYSAQFPSQHRTPDIILCPAGLDLPRSPTPCTEPPGENTLGWLMVHVLAHINLISGANVKIDDLEPETARQVTEKVLMGEQTIGDANAYAFLGEHAWAVGLGGPPWHQRRTCLENLRRGDVDADVPENMRSLRWIDIQG